MTNKEPVTPEERISKFNTLYNEADMADKSVFSEQRSNINLYLGNHYSNKEMSGLRSLQKIESSSAEKKLRLVKNHIGIICDRLINATVTSHNPDVIVEPRHKSEVQDKKAADISNGVWQSIKNANRMPELVSDFAFNFIIVGEIIGFVNYDTSKGKLINSPLFDEMGTPVVDEATGMPAQESKFNGEVFIQNLEPFNVLTDPSAKSWDEAEWVMYRKMVDVKVLKAQYKDDPELVEKITKTSDETYTIFDAQKGSYGISTKDKALVKYIFYRPCHEYKEGYYFAFTGDALLEQGSLNGVWPLAYRAYQKVTTSRRGFGIIKRLRPSQAEINRIASTIAMSQLQNRSRLLIQNGSKISAGGTVGGAYAIKYSGAIPVAMAGESGERYLPVLQSQITELYQLANLSEEETEKVASTDSSTLLYRSLKDKKKFSQKSDIFESFLKEVCEICLKTAKLFYDDTHLIGTVDKKDMVNIEEFKNIDDFALSIEVKPQTNDINSTLGEMQAIQHAIQYGQNLPPEQLAVLVANMPFLKDTSMAQDLTSDYRAVEDIFASIERGQYIPAHKYDNHKYIIKKTSNKMKESAFNYLSPEVQQMYQYLMQEHEVIEAENADKIQRATMGMIPSGGALVPISIYLDEKNASKRVRLPHDAVVWLVKKLNEQGSLQHDAAELGNSGVQAEIAGMMQPQGQLGLEQPQNNTPQMNPLSGFEGQM